MELMHLPVPFVVTETAMWVMNLAAKYDTLVTQVMSFISDRHIQGYR
jgi:hypothetical protein